MSQKFRKTKEREMNGSKENVKNIEEKRSLEYIEEGDSVRCKKEGRQRRGRETVEQGLWRDRKAGTGDNQGEERGRHQDRDIVVE